MLSCTDPAICSLQDLLHYHKGRVRVVLREHFLHALADNDKIVALAEHYDGRLLASASRQAMRMLGSAT